MTSHSSKENVERLYKQREELEAEMASISQRLNGPNMPGVKGALVDNEGFPIGGGDLDLYSVRADRQRYNSLKNDHLKLTNMIEREVQALLSSSSNNRGGGEAAGEADTDTTTVNTKENIEQKAVESTVPKTEAATTMTTTTTTTNRKAFAVVDILAPGSPADTDGLMLHDRVLDFGGAFSISDAAALIQNNVGKSHRVVVNRAGMDEIVNITPRTWSGNGLLGAHFRALNF
jgi:26S proteasome non-ATPase regulatory subunit 9